MRDVYVYIYSLSSSTSNTYTHVIVSSRYQSTLDLQGNDIPRLTVIRHQQISVSSNQLQTSISVHAKERISYKHLYPSHRIPRIQIPIKKQIDHGQCYSGLTLCLLVRQFSSMTFSRSSFCKTTLICISKFSQEHTVLNQR